MHPHRVTAVVLVLALALSFGPVASEASKQDTPIRDVAGPAAPLAVILVNSEGDGSDPNAGTISDDGICDGDPATVGPQCTLRAAIQNANVDPNADRIIFAPAVSLIQPGSVLPRVNHPVEIDGTTSGDYVELRGSLSLPGGDRIFDPIGLAIRGGNSTVRGMVINRFNTAIEILGGTGNHVENNRIGTDVSGTVSDPDGAPNSGDELGNGIGILIFSGDNTIGGAAAGQRNVISSNNVGVSIAGPDATENRVWGNYIGVDATGTQALGNRQSGVDIGDAGRNVIGALVDPDGDVEGLGNVISANGADGVHIQTRNAPADDNLVAGNLIGTNAAGDGDLGNAGAGVITVSATGTIIGGSPTGRNVISGNGAGVVLAASSASVVQSNYIGLSADGTADLGNDGDGINVAGGGPNANRIGGSTAGTGNVISGNGGDGIDLAGGGTSANLVLGNRIGTNAMGDAAIGNDGHGVHIGLTNDNHIGGTAESAGNVISGNGGHGVFVDGILGGPTGNVIEGNHIGTSADGSEELGNGGDGVRFVEGSNTVIGGTAPGAGNVISGNQGHGLYLAGVNARQNRVEGNVIGADAAGTDDVGNGGDGVRIENGGGFAVGGTAARAGNTIAFNGGAGIVLPGCCTNPFLGNAIFANAGLGIDLGADGVTLNDLGDGDQGPNSFMNFPVLTSASGNRPTIAVVYFGQAGATFRLEFFASEVCDPSGHGEGRRFLGATTINSGGGSATFSFTSPVAVPVGSFLTATATRDDGSTSEFSRCLRLPTAASGAVYWDDPQGGVWNDPNNWLPSFVPMLSNTAVITRNGTYSVSLDFSPSVAGLVVGGSSGTQTLQVGNFQTLALRGDGSVGDHGVLRLDAGTLTGAGDLALAGTLDWLRGTMVGNGLDTTTEITADGVVTLAGADEKQLHTRTIVNDGTVRWPGTGTFGFFDAVFDNNGTFDAQNDALMSHATGATTLFDNGGTFRKSAGSGTTTVGVPFRNSGIVEVRSGVLHFQGQFVQTAGTIHLDGGNLSAAGELRIEGGTLAGSGVVTATVVNGGTASPGDSPGTLTVVGNYTQSPTGTLAVEIGGARPGRDYDRLVVTGNATLSGTLHVTLTDGFEPATGDRFRILEAATIAGTFADVVVRTSGGRTLEGSFDPATGEVVIRAAAPTGLYLPFVQRASR